MKELKAMVVKVNKSNGTMVVVTEDKQFRRMPLPRNAPDLGSTIEISLPPERKSLKNFIGTKWLAAAAVLLLALGISMFGSMGISPVSAYVTLDMTPSVQLSVNKSGKVIEATALNDDGKKLLSKLDVKNKDVYLAVEDAVKLASGEGFFDAEKENLVMATVSKLKGSSAYLEKEKLRSVIYDELSSGHYPGYIVINETDRNSWENANKSGYSINRAIVTERIKANGMSVDPDNLNNKDVMHVINSSKSSVSTLFPENSYKVNWATKQNADLKGEPDIKGAEENKGYTYETDSWHNLDNLNQQEQQQNYINKNDLQNNMVEKNINSFNSSTEQKASDTMEKLNTNNDNFDQNSAPSGEDSNNWQSNYNDQQQQDGQNNETSQIQKLQ